jgi:hypothetical protein
MTEEDLRVLTELGSLHEDGPEDADQVAAPPLPAYSTEYGSATRCVQA